MEEYSASKNHRTERLRRNKSALGDGKWLRRRFQRDAATLKRMTESLDVENMTDTPFYRTFFPTNMENTATALGVEPVKMKKMVLDAHRNKKTKISKARARSRQTKVTEQTSYFVQDDHYASVPQYAAQAPEVAKAWDDHIALLKREAKEREIMIAAAKALRAQQNSFALERGTKRKWSDVV